MREKIVVIRCNVRGIDSFHFTRGDLQWRKEGDSGERDLWFPVWNNDVFKSIEAVLVLNGIANNVVNVSQLREGDTYQDYEVDFNRAV